MANKKAIIFDMDGVIIDSEKYWKQAEYEVFTSLGVKVTDEYSEITKSMTTSEVTQFWHDKYPWKNKDAAVVEQMVISRVIELIETENCQINGVKSFIEKLKIKKYKIGLATNSPSRIIPVVLKKLDILHLFDSILSAEFEEKGKPDPAVYYRAAEKLFTKPEDCIVIEDSYSGMLAAKNAGITVVAFTNGNKEIECKIADYKIDSFENNEIELLKMN
ncbi:HAD-IA family hydrolase [Labilibaculum sp. K2S]|uniref:HAD family hydrolase n=1 Tax=Labilibaculum sp. K2S TaxID=3056386 RepID=UPI0025A346DE|nr:HAD-IA family hydrolase [Labilibaculum sp. K2S]MDM8159949.1 HAD-IA family hydrolase [Labilibaculum sp. K2S]